MKIIIWHHNDKYIEEHIPVIRERTKKILAEQKEPLPFDDLPNDYAQGEVQDV